MREILFRGKTDKGEWVCGDLLHPDFCGNGYSIEDFTKEKNNCFDVIPETVGQYTGLRDCKRTEEYPEGQKIFEGDIVKLWGQSPYFVEFKNGGFEPFVVKGWECEVDAEQYEVIGNIQDNPELLEGENDKL